MKVSKRTFLKIGIGLFVTIALISVFLYQLPYLIFRGIMKVEVEREQQRKVCLLSETDHQTLLEACRELSERVSAGDLKPNSYLLRDEPHPESRFPQLILDIEPMRITVRSDGRIMVEMLGGFHHYGVIAYPENFENPPIVLSMGTKKLLMGYGITKMDTKVVPSIKRRLKN